MGRFPAGTLKLVAHRVAEIVAALDRLSHYELLEVDSAADEVEIGTNYKLMAQAYREIMAHPDCPETLYHDLALLCERLRLAAWVLCDPVRREAYDDRAAQRRVRREDSLHPIIRRSTSGQIELEDGFDLDDGEPTISEFTPLRHHDGPAPPRPEPALFPAELRDDPHTHTDPQFSEETVGFRGRRDDRHTRTDPKFSEETVGFRKRRDTLVSGEPEWMEDAEEATVADVYSEEQTVPMQVPPAVVIGKGDGRGGRNPQ